MGEIIVVAEHRQGTLREITFELVAMARALRCSSKDVVSVLLAGHRAEPLAAELAVVGDRVLHLEHAELESYDAERYLAALAPLLAARGPELVLLGHSAAGMDLAPALALRLGVPLCTDCVAVARRPAGLEVVRHAYGGKLVETLALAPAPTTLLTLRPGCVPAPARTGGPAAAIETLGCPDLGRRRGRRLLGYDLGALEDIDIAAADVLVSIGRGVGKPENMPVVQAFADALGATLSCSRPVADKGWLPKSRQVGTSGKTVRPRLYFALGISGAYQHVAGMRNADTILAINRDPAAPIFDVAHFGIVGDMFDIIGPLQQRLVGR